MDKKIVFACDIGGSKLLCGFVDEDGNILDSEKIMLSPDISSDIIENNLADLYKTLCERNPELAPWACGINIPGLADTKNGIWVYACFSGISEFPIAERMSKRLNLPVYIENDVNACAMAEKRFGRCRDCDDFLWVTVSNGIGGGLILNGKIYQGAFGGAGEFGHIIVEDDGPVCPCGHKGCAEAVAAGPGISRRYKEQFGVQLTAAEIAQMANNGDTGALSIIRKTGEYIGKALGRSASLLNLQRYVLGGGVMQSFDLMIDDIREAFNKEAFARPNKDVEILPTSLKYEAGLLGAATVAFEADI